MRAGKRAARPQSDWRPPDRVMSDDEVVVFEPENSGDATRFGFRDLPVAKPLRVAFASAFATLTAPDGSHRSVSTAQTTYAAIKRFSRRLAEFPRPPLTASDLTPAHLAEVRLATPRDYIKLKTVLRVTPGITTPFAAALLESNPRRNSDKVSSLSKGEHNAVMSAARHDLRLATERIHRNRRLLKQWRNGEISDSAPEYVVGRALDHLDAFGDLPREASATGQTSRLAGWFRALGGPTREFASSLHLSGEEALSAGVLLAGMTGQNYAGIRNLTAEHTRADGDGTTGSTKVAIVEVQKPRRGARRRYMTSHLADIPDSILSNGETKLGSLNTPFGVFATILDLTRDSRRHSGMPYLLIYPASTGGGGHGRHWARLADSGGLLGAWSSARNLKDDMDANLVVTWPRLRLTFVRMHQRGVAHTDNTLANQYLLRDARNIEEYQQLVASVLASEEDKAREYLKIRVISDADLSAAGDNVEVLANKHGIDVGAMTAVLAGDRDTALGACVDDLSSPFTTSGSPCDASFLLCLRCPNARATPQHLPVQALAHHMINELRTIIPPHRWAARFAAASARLRDLLNHYSPERVAEALASATPHQVDLVKRLLAGELDTP